jgi:thioredoxin-like negative regulator of GroEL
MRSLLFFGAAWCRPCMAMKPVIKKLEKDYTVYYHDVDNEHNLAAAMIVKSVPTTIVMDNDVEVVRWVGTVSEKKLREALNDTGKKGTTGETSGV